MTQSTIKELFINEFDLNPDEMEIMKPYSVEEANIGVEAFDEKTGKIDYAKVISAIKKNKQSSYRIKVNNEWQEPMAGAHMVAISKDNNNKVCYVFISDLIKGMKVLTTTGEAEVTDIERLEDDYCYDIQTSFGNYFTGDILSHNTMMSHAIVTTGGFALKYAASTLMRVKKITDLKDDEGNLAGIQMNVRNYKNKTGIPWRDCNMDLWFNKGFEYTGEYIDFIKDLKGDSRLDNIIELKGSYYKSEKFDFSLCGRAAMYEWAKNPVNAEKWKEITSTIDAILDGTLKEDKNHYDPELEADLPDEVKQTIKFENSLDELSDQALIEASELKLTEED